MPGKVIIEVITGKLKGKTFAFDARYVSLWADGGLSLLSAG